jgi:uroporphyrinogen decarboxylase
MMPLLDYYKDAGMHLFDPVDPQAGMDLAEIKAKYGRDFALKGNVNCATTLVKGSIDDVVRETKRCLEIGKPGGGYIISSSNTIHSSVNPENYRVMLDTIFENGNY